MHSSAITAAPGPQGLELASLFLQVAREGLLPAIERTQRRYGDSFELPIGRGPMFVSASPEVADRVLRTEAASYVKRRAYREARELLGDGLVTSDGASWARQRQRMTPVFRRSGVAALLGTIDRDPNAGVLRSSEPLRLLLRPRCTS